MCLFSQAFLALKTGVVDGAEADASGAYSQKFHVAAPNVTLTNHLMSALHISVKNSRISSLLALDFLMPFLHCGTEGQISSPRRPPHPQALA